MSISILSPLDKIPDSCRMKVYIFHAGKLCEVQNVKATEMFFHKNFG